MPLCLPFSSHHFTSLHATSLLPFCLPHFTPLHATSLCLQFSSHHFTSLHATSLHLPFSFNHFDSLHATSRRLPFFCITSPHFVQLCFASPPFSLPHFTPLHFTSRFVRLHSTPFCFASRFVFLTSCHFVPLQSIAVTFASLHKTSHNFTSPPICLLHFMPLHVTSLHLQFFLPHFMPLHSTSIRLPSFCLTSPHLTSSHLSAHPANFTIFAKDSDIRKIQLW